MPLLTARIHDLLARHGNLPVDTIARTLADDRRVPGSHEMVVNGHSVARGVSLAYVEAVNALVRSGRAKLALDGAPHPAASRPNVRVFGSARLSLVAKPSADEERPTRRLRLDVTHPAYQPGRIIA